MLSRFLNFLRIPTSKNSIDLTFELDFIDGKNRVKIFQVSGDGKEPIDDIYSLLSNPYRVKDKDGNAFLIKGQDRKLISSLKSLNPRICEDGALEFELMPPVFSYLRTSPRVIETENAQRLKVSKKPAHCAAKVDFIPEMGLQIQYGLQHPDLGENLIIPPDQVQVNRKHDYLVMEDLIVPIRPGDERAILEMNAVPSKEVPLEETPEVLSEQLTNSQKGSRISFTERANPARVFRPPVQPAVHVDYEPGKGLVLQTGFQDDGGTSLPEGKKFLPVKKARRSKSGQFLILDDTFTPIASDPDGTTAAIHAQDGRVVPENEIPEFLTEEVERIKKPVVKVLSREVKKIDIHEDAQKPTIEVNFDPDKGVTISSGYELGSQKEIIPSAQLQTTKSGRFAMLNGSYFAIQSPTQTKAADILRSGSTTVPLDQIPEFFQRDLVLLSKDFKAVLTDQAKRINFIEDPLVPIVRVAGNSRGWLNFEIDYQAGQHTFPHELLGSALKQKFVRINDNTWVKVDRAAFNAIENQLNRFEIEQTATGFRVPAMEFASLEEFIKSIGGTAELSQAYQDFINQLTGFEMDETYRMPEELERHLERVDIRLRPYQRAGIQWLKWLSSSYLHGLLADDMGLGKTLQAVLTLRMNYEDTNSTQHSLVLAPKSVITTWEREIQRFYPKAVILKYHGAARARYKNLLHAKSPVIFITTYATAANDVETLSRIPFNFLVLDEATQIKNPDSKRTKSVKALNAAHRLALSGTPVENRPAEMWSIFDFLMKGHLGTQSKFQEVYEGPILAGDVRASKALGRRVRPFILRRKKEQVAKDLPEKIYMKEWCELSDEQRQLYGEMQDAVSKLYQALRTGVEVNYAMNILPVLTRLKQICDHPALITGQVDPKHLYGRSEKFDWIMEKIDEIQETGEQVVIFSHFLNMLNLLQCALEQKGLSFIRIDGSTNNRQPLIDQFNQGGARVALLSLQAAGYGITLTAANHVIHADRWWNPAVEDQATDRVHRIGQVRNVYVYHILVENTLEERIEELLNEKRGMADDIINAATEGARRWTRDELLHILKPFQP